MKLIYRGAPYEFHPRRLEMVDAGVTTKYRGVSYSLGCPRLPQGENSPFRLTYRGVAYSMIAHLGCAEPVER